MAKTPVVIPTQGRLEAVVRDALHRASADADPEAAARALIPILATMMSRIPDAWLRGAIMSQIHAQVAAAIAHLPKVGREHKP